MKPRKPGQVSNCCARRPNSTRKASVKAVRLPRHKHADYYWGKVVQLQDRDAGRILAFGTGTARPIPKPSATCNVSVKSSGSTSIATGETIPRRAKSRRGMFRDSFVAKQADKRLEILSSCRKFCSAQGDFQPREFCRITVRELWLLAGGMGNTDWDAKGFVDDLRDSGFTLFAAPA